jgi:hypothetical protein
MPRWLRATVIASSVVAPELRIDRTTGNSSAKN